MKPLKLYDSGMNLIAILENATNKGYTKKLNDLWQATFSMPANDPKAKLCTPFSIVELFDGDERVDLFRILPSSHSSDENAEMISFDCEHVLATLVDDLLFQYHEKINLSTSVILNYILGFQTTTKWQLGQVDFEYFFSYKWESENLLASIFSVAEPFLADHQWTWDTTTFPWTLNLISPSSEIKTWIRYGRNLINVLKRTDPTDLCTRLYGLGYGEGVNQLTISELNNGLPYVQADTVSTYGVISRIFADTKEENAETLKAKMIALLEKVKIPRIEYSVDAAHLYQITDKSIDDFYLGAYCRTIDKEDDLTFTAKVVSINKPDLDGAPGDINLEIANSPEDVAKSISTLANRQRINEVYSQGATNIDSSDYQDNCDNTHPAIIKFYVPNECVRINKCLLSYETDYFRAYEIGAASGGASSETSKVFESSSITSGNTDFDYDLTTFGANYNSNEDGIGGYAEARGGHVHTYDDDGVEKTTDGAGLHAHDVTMFSHYHYLNTSGLSHAHAVNIPSHSHDIDLPDHSHDILYGIYEFDAMPGSVVIKVDGNVVPIEDLSGNDINIVPYLAGYEGKISKGTYHTIEIIPSVNAANPLGLARITASVTKQIFVQSRGGGDY